MCIYTVYTWPNENAHNAGILFVRIATAETMLGLYLQTFWKHRTNLIHEIMIAANRRKNLLQGDLSLQQCSCSIRPKTLETILLNQNLIFSSHTLHISNNALSLQGQLCHTAQAYNNLLHRTFILSTQRIGWLQWLLNTKSSGNSACPTLFPFHLLDI